MVESLQTGVQNEDTDVTVMNTIDIAEDLPNTRSVGGPPHVVTVNALPSPSVLVTTSQGIFGDQLQASSAIKTSHIVIHDQSGSIQASLSPSASISSNDRKYKYTWDPSVFDPVLPVRCRNVKGELHKNRFGSVKQKEDCTRNTADGRYFTCVVAAAQLMALSVMLPVVLQFSGGRGRCILVGSDWYTPSEFEVLCGRASSKDWKRSIRYAGRTLQCLIEDNILQPHATSCTCSACCDNTMVSGPVRLFTPYRRKRRQEKQQLSNPVRNSTDNPTAELSPVEREMPNIDSIVTPATTQTPQSAPTALDFNEQRQWWQLEEMAKNLVRQSQELQKQVEVAKAQTAAAKDAALQQLKIQLDSEKKEAINNCRMEAQVTLSQAILEAKAEKELAVQQALEQARLEMQEKLEAIVTNKGDPTKRCANCNREALSECTGCHRVSYCGTFCQRKDWQNHQEECGVSVLITEECVEVSCDATD